MGWSSGSLLMEQIISAFNRHCDHVPFENAVEFYKDLIEAFENSDCDTLDECVDWETSPEEDPFNAAMEELHPGYFDEEIYDEDV